MEEQKKAPLTAAQRQAIKREKDKAKALGTYQQSPLERAKEVLCKHENPSIDVLGADQDLMAALTADDLGKLGRYIVNMNYRKRIEKEKQIIREEVEQTIIDKGRGFVAQKAYDIQQELLTPMSREDRGKLIADKIKSNLYLFLEYMERYQPPTNDFLQLIVELKSELDKVQFTEVFVRVCQSNKIETLKVTQDMVQEALQFLISKKDDPKAAYGLTRLIYFNSISLSQFSRSSLMKFQETYTLAIQRFWKTLQHLEQQVVDSLPASPFCFTSPVLQALKEGGRILCDQIPYDFLPFVIEITCLSFNENQDSFKRFILCFKEGIRDHYNCLQRNGFSKLLNTILDQIKEMKPRFFGSLDYSSIVLERAFNLLKEKKILSFDEATIEDIIEGDQEVLKKISLRPSIGSGSSVKVLQSLVMQLQKKNMQCEFDFSVIAEELQGHDLDIFKGIGIIRPLPLQTLSFNYCKHQIGKSKFLLALETGQGKTALCLAVGCMAAKNGATVCIINASPDLTFRDYKKAEECSKRLNVVINFIQDPIEISTEQPSINYISFDVFTEIVSKCENNLLRKLLVIVDEFDSVAVSSKELYMKFKENFKKISFAIGLTGSDLKDCHVKLIEQELKFDYIRMNGDANSSNNLVCWGVEVVPLVSDHRNIILKACLAQTEETPVIIIAEDPNNILKKKLEKSGLPVEALHSKSFQDSNASLSQFTKRHGNNYGVYIINESQGRGLDFMTTSDIEANGGIYLLICKLPTNYLQYRQFLGRTGRVGNKGQYSVLLFDSEAKNIDGQFYLDKKLEALVNYDLTSISSWSQIMAATDPNLNDSSNIQIVNLDDHQAQGQKAVEAIIQSAENISMNAQNQKEPSIRQLDKIEDQNEKSSQSDIDSIIEEAKVSELPYVKKRSLKDQLKIGLKSIKNMSQANSTIDDIDFQYFQSYEDPQIHEEMERDEVRMSSFKHAINALSRDKVVVDVGTGTGILAALAIDSGASYVYAIEASKIASKAQERFNQKQYRGKVSLHHCRAEDFKLSRIKADLIVSEWMGYFLLFENMLPSVLAVRDRVLKDGGDIIPREAVLIIGGYKQDDSISQIEAVPNQNSGTIAAKIDECPSPRICTSIQEILQVKLWEDKCKHPNFQNIAKLKMFRDGVLAGICGWFRCVLAPGVVLDTSPFSPLTHWKQTIFEFPRGIELKSDEVVSIDIKVEPKSDNHRALNVHLKVKDSQGQQLLDQIYDIA